MSSKDRHCFCPRCRKIVGYVCGETELIKVEIKTGGGKNRQKPPVCWFIRSAHVICACGASLALVDGVLEEKNPQYADVVA